MNNLQERYSQLKEKLDEYQKEKMQYEILLEQSNERLHAMLNTLKETYGLNSLQEAKEYLVSKEKELLASMDLMDKQLKEFEDKL